MKQLSILVISLFAMITTGAQQIGLNAIAGVTVVDVEKAMETVLEDWDQFSYGGFVYGFYPVRDGISIGGEIGFHRLYYWEERYGTAYGTYYRWGDISTVFLGPSVKLQKNNFYVQPGIDLRIFTNGSGVVPGILFGAGYEILLTENLTLPVGIRADVIFGSATPIPLNASIGIAYTFE